MYTMHGYVKMEIMCHCYMYCYREKVKYVIPTDVVFNIAIPLSTSFINRKFSDSFEDK
jgi:hypothetical protein